MSKPAITPPCFSEKKEYASEAASAPLADTKRNQPSTSPHSTEFNSSPSATQASPPQPQTASNMGVQSQIQARGAGSSRNGAFTIALTVAVALYFAFTVTTRVFDFRSFTSTENCHQPSHASAPAVAGQVGKLVPLEAHIMSKCPDTKVYIPTYLPPHKLPLTHAT